MNFITRSLHSLGKSSYQAVENAFSKVHSLINIKIIAIVSGLFGSLLVLRSSWSKKVQKQLGGQWTKIQMLFTRTMKKNDQTQESKDEMQQKELEKARKKLDVTEKKLDATGEKIEETGKKIEEAGKKIEEARKKIEETRKKIEETRKKEEIVQELDDEVEKAEEREQKLEEEKKKVSNASPTPTQHSPYVFVPPPPSSPPPPRGHIKLSPSGMQFPSSTPKYDPSNTYDYEQILIGINNFTPNLVKNISYLPMSKTSCRYTDIGGPPRDTHVKMEGDTNETYLNANYVTLDEYRFIATQCPLPDQNERFWLMCEEASLILDLTNDSQKEASLSTYAQLETLELEKLSISREEDPKPDNNLKALWTTYNVEKAADKDNGSFYSVPRLHYNGWPDNGATSVEDLDRLLKAIDSFGQNPKKPIVVHCAAGIGRTLTVIIAYVLKKGIEKNKVVEHNLLTEIQKYIFEVRKQRNPYGIASPAQLELLHRWGLQVIHARQQLKAQ